MKKASPEITRHNSANGGRYTMQLEGGAEAEMTYRTLDDNTISIDHTGVPDAFRGQGLAQLLVERGINDARSEGVRIVPTCPYVAVQFRRHPEWADVLAD